MHEHYDDDGNYTGRTEVTRESPWDADSRGRALRLAEYEANICPCGCNQPIDVAWDPQQPFKVDHIVCQAGRAMSKVIKDEQDKAKARNAPDDWDAGRRYYVTPVEAPTPKGE